MADHILVKHYNELPFAKLSDTWRIHCKMGYNLNQHGFRSQDFHQRKDINVASIGCSNTLGWSLPIENRFSTIFCNKLETSCKESVQDWNFGLAGKSNDYILRVVKILENTINPDIYLISFTGLGRREYWDNRGNCIDYVPNNYPEIVKKTNPSQFHNYKKIHLLQSEFDNIQNFIKNFHAIEGLLKNKNWYFTFSCGNEMAGTTDGSIEDLIPQDKYVGYFHYHDWADDGLHPGPESNKVIAESFLDRYLNEPVGQTHIERSDEIVRYF